MLSIHYIHLNAVPSTSTWAKERALSFNPRVLTCISADMQTAGRGRFNRKWLSAAGNNIYASFHFCLPLQCPFLSNVGQILSLACVRVLGEMGVELQIKWPNDLLIQGKKVGGILCETFSLQEELHVILGLGINVDLPLPLLESIDQPATSLQQVLPKKWDREELLQLLAVQCARCLQQLKEEGFAPFRDLYMSRLAYKDTELQYRNGTAFQGWYHSINEQGQLVIRLKDGTLVTLSSGEINPASP